MLKKSSMLIALASLATGCASAPPRPVAPAISLEQKMTWILQLEDQRILATPPPAPPPVTTPPPKRKTPPPPPVVLPDLVKLAADPEARVRRRAALGIGRVGLPEGVAPLQTLLGDVDPEVREMAAFALGLVRDKSAVAALTKALQDADGRVKGRAAEALGLVGESAPPPEQARLTADEQQAAATAIGAMVKPLIQQGALAQVAPDDEQWPKTPEIEAIRLGLFALVRLKGWDALSSAVLDASGRPVSSWWPVAYALQRIGDPRAAAPLRALLQTPGRYTRAFAARGLGGAKDASSSGALVALLQQAKGDVAVTVSVLRALGQIEARDAAAPIAALLTADGVDPNVRLEAVNALGALKATSALPAIQDFLTDDWPALRAASLRAAAAVDPDSFVLLLSGLEPDRHWTVRAALADVLGTLKAETAAEQLRAMLTDTDRRVVPSVIQALTRLRVPGLDEILLAQLKDSDFAIRAAAARGIGVVKPAGGAQALRAAFEAAGADARPR